MAREKPISATMAACLSDANSAACSNMSHGAMEDAASFQSRLNPFNKREDKTMKADAKQPEDTYRIVEMQADNIKKLTAIQLRPSPDGGLVIISGKNGAGKSSLFDAIEWALEGRKAMPSEPIRTGADSAEAVIDLGPIVVKRNITRRPADEGGGFESGVMVVRKDGSPVRSPQHVLDTFFGSFTFDPGEFLRKKPAEQADALKQLVPGFDFAHFALAHDKDFKKRTDIGRDADREKAYAATIVVPDGTPDELIDTAALKDQRDRGAATNSEIAVREARRVAAQDQIEASRDHAEKLRAQAATLEQEADALEKKLKDAPPLPKAVNVDKINAALDSAAAVNAAVERKKEKREATIRAKDLADAYDTYTKQIDDRKAAKLKAIASAKLPVAGLAFGDDDQIRLNGVPFDQASTAEQLRCALAIGMATDSKLRAIFIREGSMFDDDSLDIIAATAREHGWQVWIEKVAQEPGDVGFFIEDGALVGTPAADTKPAKTRARK